MGSTDREDHSKALKLSSPHFIDYLRTRSESASIVYTALATCALSLLICAFLVMPRVERVIMEMFEEKELRTVESYADNLRSLLAIRLELLWLAGMNLPENNSLSRSRQVDSTLQQFFHRIEIYDVSRKRLYLAGTDSVNKKHDTELNEAERGGILNPVISNEVKGISDDIWLKEMVPSKSDQFVQIFNGDAGQIMRIVQKIPSDDSDPIFVVGYSQLDHYFQLEEHQSLVVKQKSDKTIGSDKYIGNADRDHFVEGSLPEATVVFEKSIEPYDLVMTYSVNLGQLSEKIQSLLWILMILLGLGLTLIFGIIVQFSRYLLRSTSRKAEDMSRGHASISERLRTVLDTMVDGVVMTDTRGIINNFNTAAEEIFGYKTDEVIGKNVSILAADNHSDRHDSYLANYLASGDSRKLDGNREVTAKHKDGRIFTLELGVNEYLDETENEIVFVAVARDLSNTRISENKLRDYADGLEKQKSELEQAKKAAEIAVTNKKAFIATVSHEIRTPMNGVLGMTGLLANTTLDEEQKTYVEAIRESGDTLLFLINDLLDFSKLEANKLELDKRDFLPMKLIESAVALVATQAAEKGISMAAYIEPTVPQSLHGDPGRIRQILMNYLSNAVKFNENGGTVEVHMSSVVQKQEEVRIRVEVHDTGIGIAEELKKTIFKDFTQADSSITRRYGGTGLGLSICKRIAQLMDGGVGVESEVGKGSVFWAEVVLKVGAAILHPLASAGRDLSLLKVMLIDSHPLNREIFSRQLTKHRISCSEYGDMEAALDEIRRSFVRQNPYNVVLLDEELAKENEDIYNITQQRKHSPCFLILTSVMGSVMTSEMRDRGIYLSITKPIKESALIDILAQISEGIRGNSLPQNSGQGWTDEPGESAGSVSMEFPSKDQPLNLKVLVVEDSIVSQQFATGLLNSWGCSVVVAANGLEAIAAVSDVDFDLVLMDMVMPEMNGIEATEKIRMMKGIRGQIPIVGVTGNVLDEDRKLFLEAGVGEVIIKPLDRVDLWHAIQRQLPGPQSGRIDPKAMGKKNYVDAAQDEKLNLKY